MSNERARRQSPAVKQGPTARQYVGYLFGKTLPDSLQDWVRNDLVGKGATARYLIRGLVPLIPVICVFFFVPGSLLVRVGMMLLLVLPLIYFLFALMQIYRRHLLAKHGLDPALVNERTHKRAKAEKADYEARFKRESE